MALEDTTTNILKQIRFAVPTAAEFEKVKAGIAVLQLDGRALDSNNFLVAKNKEKIIAFGQLKTFSTYQEISSIGVLPPFDGKGVASKLIKELLKKRTKPVFLVTVIPDFFKKLDFIATNKFPESLNEKLDYCSSKLAVEEKYVVMKFKE